MDLHRNEKATPAWVKLKTLPHGSAFGEVSVRDNFSFVPKGRTTVVGGVRTGST
jgi:hypothetical protein